MTFRMTFLIVAMSQICIATNWPKLHQYPGQLWPNEFNKNCSFRICQKNFFLSRYSMYLNLSHGMHFVHIWLLYRIQKIEKLKKLAKVTPFYGTVQSRTNAKIIWTKMFAPRTFSAKMFAARTIFDPSANQSMFAPRTFWLKCSRREHFLHSKRKLNSSAISSFYLVLLSVLKSVLVRFFDTNRVEINIFRWRWSPSTSDRYSDWNLSVSVFL